MLDHDVILNRSAGERSKMREASEPSPFFHWSKCPSKIYRGRKSDNTCRRGARAQHTPWMPPQSHCPHHQTPGFIPQLCCPCHRCRASHTWYVIPCCHNHIAHIIKAGHNTHAHLGCCPMVPQSHCLHHQIMNNWFHPTIMLPISSMQSISYAVNTSYLSYAA